MPALMRFARVLLRGSLLLPLATGPVRAQATAAGLDIRLNVKVPLRDAVRLNATLYFPRDSAGARPVILAMTPYTTDSYHRFVLPIAKRGFVVAVVDVRGRGGSEGVFNPFAQEAWDGYDTVEWIARQPWCNGKVGMIGGSYGGFNQWAIAKEKPPHLAAIAPTAAPYMGVDWPALGGIWPSYMVQWLAFTSGHAANTALFSDVEFWRDRFRERYEKGLPFASLDSIAGYPSLVYQEWMKHPDLDAFWLRMAPSPKQLAELEIPVFTRTGMYDNAQIGALEHYRNHMRYGSAAVKARHFLMIGPWEHSGTRTPLQQFGGLSFGPESMLDMGELEADWFDWTLRGGSQPTRLPRRVAYYVTGAEVWKYADGLEEIGRNVTRFFLTSPGALVPREPSASAPDEWTHDPLGPPSPDRVGLVASASALDLGGRGMVYETEPFTGEREVSGFPTLTLWMTFDVPDADLVAELHEVTREGKSILIDDARLRLRYRNSLAKPELLTPGKPTRIELNRFRFMSRLVAAGSRIRLVLRSPATVDLEVNYQSGGAVAFETGRTARQARIKLHHEPEMPSVLSLPLMMDP